MPMRHSWAMLTCLWLIGATLPAADWLTFPSYYSHDPNSGQRVAQFSPIGPFYVYSPPNATRSGYRHYRSTIQAGGSADNFHMVEEWGKPVVPYEQWRFPYRPYGAPYDAWGPPLAGAQINNQFGPNFGAGWYGNPTYQNGQFNPVPLPNRGPNNGSPYYQNPGPAPWIDGHWPTYDGQDRSNYYRPYGR